MSVLSLLRSMLRSKLSSFKNKLNTKREEFIDKNIKVNSAISELERISKVCLLLAAPSAKDYLRNNYKDRLRIALIILGRISCILTAIKFVLSAISEEVCH